jgi:hypothetical protein
MIPVTTEGLIFRGKLLILGGPAANMLPEEQESRLLLDSGLDLAASSGGMPGLADILSDQQPTR